MARIEMDGLNGILEGLNRLGAGAAKAETRILKESAKIVQEKAKQNLEPHRSNLNKKHLADNIKISSVKRGIGGRYVLVGPSKGDNSEFFYGKFLEWGTSKMTAKPFLEPALNESQNEIMDKARTIVREELA